VLFRSDAIKEGMHVTHGSDDPAEVRRFSAAAFTTFWATVGALVDAGSSVVAEAAFHREFATPELARLATHADVVLVWCVVDPAVATERYAGRAARGERHPAHADDRFVAEMRDARFDWASYSPPDGLWPTHLVDTATPPTVDALVSWVRGARAAGRRR
jgi:predicted kinase